ncbi:type VI secretion system protein TssA [Geomonas azotofigens]|uniref:type VI secretion system protein TssA n=1 Tax=Geomonas azotofigens TaxID=2843196 RepID=UPI001C0FF079|nr:type VI secretion system protein TssA [Geomonas azotofigens]MBU5613047.1 type VI secretion system protein TssA [Geomonas azotofigens]
MLKDLSIEKLLLPISAESPAGRDLRYTPVYEEIMEARRCEDAVAMGDWQHDVKQADWGKAISLAVSVLSTETKDLQVAVWLAEALSVAEGFAGLALGLELVTGLTERFWETAYPQTEDGDHEYRATPFQFLADKIPLRVRQIPLTDPEVTPGYSWLRWRESRDVGSEAGLRNRYGEIDEDKKSRRDQLLAESAVSAEDFDAAVARSGGAYGAALHERITSCSHGLRRLETVLEEKFPAVPPSLAELASVIADCGTVVEAVYGTRPAAAPVAAGGHPRPAPLGESGDLREEGTTQLQGQAEEDRSGTAPDLDPPAAAAAVSAGLHEHSLWEDALALVQAGRLQEALAALLHTGNGADSVRDRNRVRLLMVKLCLDAGRADLARPLLEDLHGVIEELQLERWESPLWIAEVLVAYYRCLQAGGPRDSDLDLANTLFKRICLLDVTKAMPYRC